MPVNSSILDKLNPETAIWLIVAAIVLMEIHHVRKFLAFILIRLYELFIQHFS